MASSLASWLTRATTALESTSSISARMSATQTGIRSPWTEGQLEKLVWSDVFGTIPLFVTRAEALTIPGVYKARAILLSLIADKRLTALRNGELLDPQPRWLYWTSGLLGPWQRMAMTVDDLIFYGWSLWGRRVNERGEILDAWRIPYEDWEFDDVGRVMLRDANGDLYPANAADVILIPGPASGLVDYAARTLRAAAELETSWAKRSVSPIPAIELHETTMSGITEDEARAVVDAWAAARRDPNGAIAFTPYNVEARALGSNVAADLFIEGRNASRIDIANFFNLPAQLLDGSLSTASLTYSTQEGRRNDVLDYGLPYWIRPIEARLSQDDVVPNGQSVAFDFGPLVTTAAPALNVTPD